MVSKLTFLNGPRRGEQVRLDKARSIIGRDPAADLRFDPRVDRAVSLHHAELVQGTNPPRIIDYSSNGTLVNGKPVSDQPLHTGDVLEFGPDGPRLRYDGAEDTATDSPQEQPVGANLAGKKSSRRTLLPLPITVTKLADGKQLSFCQAVVRIGRDPTAEVCFDPEQERLVSFSHAKITCIGGRATLFDLESTNGVLLNGRRVSRIDLEQQETVELGPGGPKLRIAVDLQPSSADRPSAAATLYASPDASHAQLSLGQAELLGEFPLAKTLRIGRQDCEIRLDSMYVSKHHATISSQDGQVRLVNHSPNGTFVAGIRVDQASLELGAEFVVGPYILKRCAKTIQLFDTRMKAWLSAQSLQRWEGERTLLDRVPFRIAPGELICVLGPSGCGKSTLVKCLNGHTPPNSGTVWLNNIDFYQQYTRLKHYVSYLPQDDIVHPQLTVEQTLAYAALLRLPQHVPAQERQQRVREVLSSLELMDHRDKAVHTLSGGQRKRVSLGVELLTEPAIVFLDEPTSGLDPSLEEKLMLLLREITLRGKSVVVVTHGLAQLHLADNIAVLAAGKLVYFGPPEEALTHFDVETLADIYRRLEVAEEDAEQLRTAYVASPLYKQNFHQRGTRRASGGEREIKRTAGGARLWLHQFWTLVRRNTQVLLRDRKSLAAMLAQAPLIGALIAIASTSDEPQNQPTAMALLMMSLSALWFGCSNAARALTSDRTVFLREKMVGLRVSSHVVAKFAVLQSLSLVQVLLLVLSVTLLRPGLSLDATKLPPSCEQFGIVICRQLVFAGLPGPAAAHVLNLYLTATSGLGLGLLVSAVARNSDRALSLLPLVLIPQVLFSGAFFTPQASDPAKRGLGYLMPLNWSYDRARRIAMCDPEQERGPQGCTSCLHAYDPRKHERAGKPPQEDDAWCAAIVDVAPALSKLPENITLVEDGLYTAQALHQQGDSRRAHRSSRALYVLAGSSLLWLLMVCFALSRAQPGSTID